MSNLDDLITVPGVALVEETAPSEELRGGFLATVGSVGVGVVRYYTASSDTVPVFLGSDTVYFERTGALQVPGFPGAWFVPERNVLAVVEAN